MIQGKSCPLTFLIKYFFPPKGKGLLHSIRIFFFIGYFSSVLKAKALHFAGGLAIPIVTHKHAHLNKAYLLSINYVFGYHNTGVFMKVY